MVDARPSMRAWHLGRRSFRSEIMILLTWEHFPPPSLTPLPFQTTDPLAVSKGLSGCDGWIVKVIMSLAHLVVAVRIMIAELHLTQGGGTRFSNLRS